jgi:hypothetical protein
LSGQNASQHIAVLSFELVRGVSKIRGQDGNLGTRIEIVLNGVGLSLIRPNVCAWTATARALAVPIYSDLSGFIETAGFASESKNIGPLLKITFGP